MPEPDEYCDECCRYHPDPGSCLNCDECGRGLDECGWLEVDREAGVGLCTTCG
jgi:hypothetical protein